MRVAQQLAVPTVGIRAGAHSQLYLTLRSTAFIR